MSQNDLYHVALGSKTIDIEYVTDRSTANSIIEKLLRKGALLGIDIETAKMPGYEHTDHAGLCPHQSNTRLVQLGLGDRAWVFDLFKLGGMPGALQQPGFTFVAHNAIFEIKHLYKDGLRHLDNIHCSQIQSMIVTAAEQSEFEKRPESDDFTDDDETETFNPKKHALDVCAARTLGLKISKELQTSDWAAPELSEDQIIYAALDAVICYRLHIALMPKVKQYGMETVYGLYKNMQHVVAAMELAGMRMFVEQHNELIKEWKDDYTRCESELRRFFGGINVNSTVQLGKWLTDLVTKRGKPEVLEAWPKTKTGRLAFGRKSIYKYGNVGWVKALLSYKKVEKQLSTYGESLRDKINARTGRIHCGFSVGRTATGRLSSYGPNLQNMPRDSKLRAVFGASDGCCLTVADFNQIEMRIAGEVSQDPYMRYAFENRIDLHKGIVHDVFGIPIAEITKKQRQSGKATNFGLIFGMGVPKLVVTAKTDYDVDLSEMDAQRAFDIFHHKRYVKYSAWGKVQRQNCKQLGYVRTPLGKMRKLTESEVYTKSLNTPIQGGAAEVGMLACIMLHQGIKRLGLKAAIVNMVHDEIIVEHDPGCTVEVHRLLKGSMERAMETVFKGAPLKGIAEIGTGKTWLEAKEKTA